MATRPKLFFSTSSCHMAHGSLNFGNRFKNVMVLLAGLTEKSERRTPARASSSHTGLRAAAVHARARPSPRRRVVWPCAHCFSFKLRIPKVSEKSAHSDRPLEMKNKQMRVPYHATPSPHTSQAPAPHAGPRVAEFRKPLRKHNGVAGSIG